MTEQIKKPRELAPMQKRFCVEYPLDLNATEAAKRAGYSKKSAEVIGYQLLQKPWVKAEIERRVAKSVAKTELTIERVDQEIARLAFADVRKLYRPDGTMLPVHEWPDDIAAAVAGVDVSEVTKGGKRGKTTAILRKLKVWDKVSALTVAARRLGLLTDKLDVGLGFSFAKMVEDSVKPKGDKK